PNVGMRGESYGMPGLTIDGNDVLTGYAVAGDAVRRARAGEGPTLIECRTYRTRAHTEGQRDAGYRTAEEVESWKARDPIKRLVERLTGEGIAAASELDAIDAEIQEMVAQAAAFAESSPWPDGATATDFVYSS